MPAIWIAVLATAAAAAPLSPETAPPDTVVVCASDYLQAMQPWIDHRQQQGHTLAFVPSGTSAEKIRQAIRQANSQGTVRWILLVGDAGADRTAPDRTGADRYGPDRHGPDRTGAGRRTIPAHHVEAVVNVRFGSEPEIATDNWYADFDDDGWPDAAVGRLPVDNEAELETAIAKILAYELSADQGRWRRQVNFVAGVGGFGKLADSVIEFATKRFLTDGVPAGYSTTMTYGSWRSPFCPDPRRFHETAVERLNEGCLFWVYIGHGQRTAVDRVQTPWSEYRILEAADAGKIASRQGAPIAIFLACYTGAFDGPQDCLAEELLKTPQGPVAVLAGSRVTMPYSMAVLAHGMLDEYFQQQRLTLGEIVLHAKRRLASEGEAAAAEELVQETTRFASSGVTSEDSAASTRLSPEETRRLLDAVAAVVSPSSDQLPAERKEHLSLFNLLGDPLLRLPQPRPIEVNVPETAVAGQAIEASGTAPIAGKYTVELVCRRDLFKHRLPMRESFDPAPASLAEFQGVYHKANDHVWASRSFDSPGGEFRIRLPAPPEAAGSCHVRVFAQGTDAFALGAKDVYIEPASSASSSAAVVRPPAQEEPAGAPRAARATPPNPIRKTPR